MEHEHIMEVVKQALVYDQLDITNLATFELLLRRAQTIEYAHVERLRESTVPWLGGGGGGKGSGGLSYEGQEAFAGASRTSIAMICPKLLDHVKEDLSRNTDLMKSILKSREFREQFSKNK